MPVWPSPGATMAKNDPKHMRAAPSTAKTIGSIATSPYRRRGDTGCKGILQILRRGGGMVDAMVSNTIEVKLVWVRVPPPALFSNAES